MRSLLLAPALALSAALAAQTPQVLTTNFNGVNANNGILFDITAGSAGVTIDTFETNLNAGTHDISIYKVTVPGPYAPHAAIPGDWTLVGSATGVVSNGAGFATLVPIRVCEWIPPLATQGFYVTITTGGTVRYTIGTAIGATLASNADLTIQTGVGCTFPFGPGAAPREFNANINYWVGFTQTCSVPAVKSNYGVGCYSNPRQVHEFFPTGISTIDLVNTNWTLAYQPAAPGSAGPTYIITPGNNPYDAIVPAILGTDLVLTPPTATSSVTPAWDDGSTNKTLPFAFPYANTGSPTTTEITINSNAKIYLGNTTDSSYGSCGANSGYAVTSFDGTTGALLPTIAGFMNDLDPVTVPGHIWYEDPSPNGGVRITWECPNWQDPAFTGLAAVMCFVQMELMPNGDIHLAYGPSLGNGGSSTNDANVGYSAGSGQTPTPSVDWSTLNGFHTGDGQLPLAMNVDIRPLLGQTMNLTVSEIPGGTLVAGIIYGFTAIPGGFPLGFIGLPGCQLYVSLDLINSGVLPGSTYANAIAIPNSLSLAGVALNTQGFALNANIPNPFQGITSNGVALVLGNL